VSTPLAAGPSNHIAVTTVEGEDQCVTPGRVTCATCPEAPGAIVADPFSRMNPRAQP
jgi:hypothetical protein